MASSAVDPAPLGFHTGDPGAPAAAQVRRWAVSVLPELDEDHLDDVLLVTTELVTNVFDHAPGAAEVRVRHHRAPCRVRVEVDDESAQPPVLGRSRIAETRGRGVLVVARLSQEWGVRPRADGGKTVWAVVGCDLPDCVRRP